MDDVFAAVFLLSLLAAFVGAVHPKTVLPWSRAPGRVKALGLYFAIAIVALVAFDPQEQQTAASKETEQHADREDSEPKESSESDTEDDLSARDLVRERMPEKQEQFLDVLAEAASEYDEAANDLKRSRIEKERREESGRYTDEGWVTDWYGVLEHMGTNSEGDAYITIRANGRVTFKTWNNALSDISSGTLIRHDSELYDVIADLSVGDPVKFSGRLLDEGSLTERGSVEEPELIVEFDDVGRVHQ